MSTSRLQSILPGVPAVNKQVASPPARLAIMERSGSFAHIEEPAAVFETLRGFWRGAA